MVQTRVAIISILILIFVSSCRVGRVPVAAGKPNSSVESYIENYKDLAIKEMKRTGVPASITLSQGIVESDMGRSSLATEANNHFGIKCHDDWSGPSIRHSDDRRNECFRKYISPGESYKDHSDFLRSEPRYKFLFTLDVTDYKGWARGLKKAGYATNPEYANMLIRKIEEYGLYNYDRGITVGKKEANAADKVVELQTSANAGTSEKNLGDLNNSNPVSASGSRVMEKNRIQYVVVRDGDTRESLEKELQLLRWELARYNELQSDFKINTGQVLYLQPKREKADVGNEIHTFTEGESMYLISQIYGIRLKSLLLLNRMTEGQEPVTGQKIWLRSVKPVNQIQF